MTINRTPEEMATVLKQIYELEFGGKGRGRYKISRSSFRQLSKRQRLEDSTITRIIDEAFEEGLIVTDLGDYFSVVEHSVMANYRPVPKSVIKDFMGEESSSFIDEDEPD